MRSSARRVLYARSAALCVLHARSEDEAREFAKALGHIHPVEKIVISEIGAVVGTHVGPGAIGFTGVRKGE